MENRAVIGTCRVCEQELIKWQGDIWHPYTCGPCPASNVGRPGENYFVYDEEETLKFWKERY